ncbi:MAG: hypothetical protein AAFV53_15100 [Myxococcota bacterium]
MNMNRYLTAALCLIIGCDTGLSETGTKVELCEGSELDEIDPVDLEQFAIDDNELTVTVGYGGGCEDHFFRMCWDGSVAESAPVQISLNLIHDGNGDSCEAYITEDLVFDLSPLDEGISTETADLSVNGASAGSYAP